MKCTSVQTDMTLAKDGHLSVRSVLLMKSAKPSRKKDDDSVEMLLYSPYTYYINPCEGQGIKTDITIELPPGIYGHVLSHQEAPLEAQAHIQGMVILPGSRKNIQLFVLNHSKTLCMINWGELLSSVIILQVFIPTLDILHQTGLQCSVV